MPRGKEPPKWTYGYPEDEELELTRFNMKDGRDRKWPLARLDGTDEYGREFVHEQHQRPDPDYPIFQYPVGERRRRLVIKSKEAWGPAIFDRKHIDTLQFTPNVVVDNRMLTDITNAPSEFRESLHNLYLGDPARERTMRINDETVAKMIRALPNLRHVRIDCAPKVGGHTLWDLLFCDDIQSITLTGHRKRVNKMNSYVLELPHWPTTLKYLNLSERPLPVYFIDCFEHQTYLRRSATVGESLEIVFNFGRYHLFWRDGYPRYYKDWDFARWGPWNARDHRA